MEWLVPVPIKVPADRNVVVSSEADTAAEVSRILFCRLFHFFLVTFLLTSPPLIVFLSRVHVERLVTAPLQADTG